jgi:threonine synthase
MTDRPADRTNSASGAGEPPRAAPPGASLNLLDGAAPEWPSVADDVKARQAVAADPTQPLEERLEAYADIFDSEVGDTQLSRARNVEREFGVRQIFLKFEGGNPTGTQKDRIAFAQAEDALRRGFDAMTLATCGNYGAACALAASLAGLRCVIYVPEGYQTRRLGEMMRYGAEIVRSPGDYETAVVHAREAAERYEIYDANPGGDNVPLQLHAYAEIAREIYDELRDAPAAVAVPVSNGTTLAGLHRGFVSLYRRGKTSRIPRLVAGSSHRKNPIIRSFRRGLEQCEDLDPAQLKETLVNEPLINWHSSDGDYALAAIRETGGWAEDASDEAMRRHAQMLRDREGLSVLPASTAGLVAFLSRHRKEPLPGDRYVVVLTGRRA